MIYMWWRRYDFMHSNATGGAEIMVDKCPTITAMAGMSGNNQPFVAMETISLETFHCMASVDVTAPPKARDYKDPIVVLDRAAYNQGEKAKYDFEVKIGGAMPPLVARGPGAVCYRKSGHCVTMTTSSHNNNR